MSMVRSNPGRRLRPSIRKFNAAAFMTALKELAKTTEITAVLMSIIAMSTGILMLSVEIAAPIGTHFVVAISVGVQHLMNGNMRR